MKSTLESQKLREMEVGHAPCLEKPLGERCALLDGGAGKDWWEHREASAFLGQGTPGMQAGLNHFKVFLHRQGGKKWKCASD